MDLPVCGSRWTRTECDATLGTHGSPSVSVESWFPWSPARHRHFLLFTVCDATEALGQRSVLPAPRPVLVPRAWFPGQGSCHWDCGTTCGPVRVPTCSRLAWSLPSLWGRP